MRIKLDENPRRPREPGSASSQGKPFQGHQRPQKDWDREREELPFATRVSERTPARERADPCA